MQENSQMKLTNVCQIDKPLEFMRAKYDSISGHSVEVKDWQCNAVAKPIDDDGAMQVYSSACLGSTNVLFWGTDY